MAYLFPHPGGAILLRRKAGLWHAEQRGRRFGRWSTADEGAHALHHGTTGDELWDKGAERTLVPSEAAAWRPTFDALENPAPASAARRRPHRRDRIGSERDE